MKAKVLVTPRSITSAGDHPALGRLRDAGCDIVLSPAGVLPNTNQLKELLPGCVGYLAGVEKISGEVLSVADRLRVISRNGTGVNSIDLAAAAARGISVCQANGANAQGVAELAIGLLIALARHFGPSNAAIKEGRWERWQGFELKGKSLGLIGCGHVGRLVARFALGLGMDVLAHDPLADDSLSTGERFQWVEFDYLLAHADIVSLHCPPRADGTPLIDDHALKRMKTGVLLLNTARYELLAREAVIAALDSGQVAGLALDVFADEPPIGDRLAHHPRVFATPHIGGYTVESVDRSVRMAVHNLLSNLRTDRKLARPVSL